MTDMTDGSIADFAVGVDSDSVAPDWSLYPRTVANRLVLDLGHVLQGAELVFASNLPSAAGLSSSSALVVATYMALAKWNDFGNVPRFLAELSSRESLAAYLGAVESGGAFGSFDGGQGVGTLGGNEDHTAILCSGRGEIRQYSYLPTRLEKIVEFPEGLSFAVAVSGVMAVKTGEAKEDYNQAARLARQLTEIWNRHTGRQDASLADVLSTGPQAAGQLEEILNKDDAHEQSRLVLAARLRHFAAESGELVPGAAAALARHDLDDFGYWVDRSQELATRLLGNQVDETVWLASAARQLGAAAASAFGAGFGGSVWALVRRDEEADFLDRWSAGYRQQFPAPAANSRFFWTGAEGPAVEL
jgi:galactokinase